MHIYVSTIYIQNHWLLILFLNTEIMLPIKCSTSPQMDKNGIEIYTFSYNVKKRRREKKWFSKNLECPNQRWISVFAIRNSCYDCCCTCIGYTVLYNRLYSTAVSCRYNIIQLTFTLWLMSTICDNNKSQSIRQAAIYQETQLKQTIIIDTTDAI